MKTYFADWEIRDGDGNIVKWANTFTECPDAFTPTKAFSEARKGLYEDLNLPEDYMVRALTFARID